MSILWKISPTVVHLVYFLEIQDGAGGCDPINSWGVSG